MPLPERKETDESDEAAAEPLECNAGSAQGESPEFGASMELAAGSELEVAPHGRKPYGRYDVLTGDVRVGALVFGGSTALAQMICADGAWFLTKRRRFGWELLIWTADGEHVGRYSGRKWLPGGTLSFTDGTQVDLRRSLIRRWTVQASAGEERFLDICTGGIPSAQTAVVTIRSSLPGPTMGRLLVLTSCAVLMLERMMGVYVMSSAQ